MTWGGARVGAGRKPLPRKTVALAGGRQRTRRAGVSDVPVEPPVGAPMDCPSGLDDATRAVWVSLAPRALTQRTLTAETADSFALLCQNMALERLMRTSAQVGGADHRGMIRLIEISLARFCLAPTGRPAVAAEAPKDEFAAFDEPLRLVK